MINLIVTLKGLEQVEVVRDPQSNTCNEPIHCFKRMLASVMFCLTLETQACHFCERYIMRKTFV